MKKLFCVVISLVLLMIIGCGANKNILFKDEIYVITKVENGVKVELNSDAHIPTVHDAAIEYVNTNAPFLRVLKYSDNYLTVTSYDYDGDTKQDFKTWEIAADKNVKFNSITVVDDKGEVTIDDILIPDEEYQYIGEFYTCGYVEFNDKCEITHVTFYGDIIIQ